MKQVVRRGLKEIVVEEVPEPLPPPHHVLIRPVCSLISSGTETASIHTEGVIKEVADNPSHLRKVLDVMKVAGPVSTTREVLAKFSEFAALGYSGAGVICDKHPTVTDLEVGERVAYGGEGTGHAETIVTGRNLVVKLPDDLKFEHACFCTLGSIALNSVRIAGIELGDRVAVIGLGLVGQLAAQLARLQGAVVFAVDLKPDRVDLARRLGAPYGFDSAAREQVLAATNGKGADCVILAAAAKTAAPSHLALQMCRDRGRIVVVGAVEMSFPWNEMYLKEIQLFLARAYGPGSYDPVYEKQGRDYPFPYIRWTENRNMEEFAQRMASRQVDVAPLITHEFPLAEAPQAYSTILDPESKSLAVVLRYPEPERSSPAESPHTTFIHAKDAPAVASFGVALAGAGNLARWEHLPAVQKIAGAALRAVYSASPVRGKSYATRFGAAYCTTDYEEVLKDPSVNVVLIASRNKEHAAQALAALRAGKHVFVEKPMALTEAECADLAQAVAESGRHLAVGFNRRFAPFYRQLKDRLARRSGPAVVSCRINSPGISGDYWMADPAGGGAILGEACHFVDLMYWLLGSEPVAVSAYSLPTGKKDPIGENNVAASFHFADGSVGNLTYCTVGSKTSAGERVEAFAQGLGLFTEDFKRVWVAGAMRSAKKKMFAEKGYVEQLRSFFDALKAGRPPEVDVRDGVRATIGCLRLMESARDNGRAVSIDLDAVAAAAK